MNKENLRYFAGIDIGTTKVRCVIGRIDDNGNLPTIVGSGEARNGGVRKGTIVDIEQVIKAVDEAVDIAEKTAGAKITSAVVNVNGVHVAGNSSKGIIAVNANDREITQDDVERAREAATVVNLPSNREIIDVFARSFRLDGQEDIHNPIGMQGVRLEVDAHVVTASTPAIRHLEQVMTGVEINIVDQVLSSIAGSRAVMTKEQQENGAVLIDIGGGTTNIAVVEEGDLQHVAVIPVGGIHITNDLAIGLKTDLNVAEAVKLQHGTALDSTSKSKTARVKLARTEYAFHRDDISSFIQARAEEIFELVDKELKKAGRSGRLPGGAVIVGGSANLNGIDEFAKNKLGLPCRISKPSGFSGVIDKLQTPEYTCATGLMLHHFTMDRDGLATAEISQKSKSGILGSILSRFKN